MSLRRVSEDRSRNERMSRNSTGVKEEFAGPRKDIVEVQEKYVSPEEQRRKDKMLMFVFVSMVFVGLGNKVFNKLMTVSSM